MDDIKSRSLDFVERYHIAQHRAGSMPYITIIGLIIHPDINQLLYQMGLNINRLLRKHPVLAAAIDDTDSRRSRWILNDHDPPFDIHKYNQYQPHPIIDSELYSVTNVTDVAKIEDGEAQELNLATGPLWRVGVYRLKLESPATFFIAMTIHHVVTDSMGALNLYQDILWQPSWRFTTSSHAIPKHPLPPKAEKTMRIQPSIAGTIKKGVRHAINHRSSWKLTHRIGVKTKWPPPSLLKAPPRRSDMGHIALDLGEDQNRVVEWLEALGNQIGSVHAVLHTAAVIALAAVASDDACDTLSVETTKSLRSKERTHPRIGGNYTGLIERSIPLSSLGSHTMASFTKKFNDYIRSPEAESEARSNAGEFRLFPDRIVPDFWRLYLEKKATSGDPYRHSLSISNLGRFDAGEILGLRKGAAINMNVVSLTRKKASDVSGRKDSKMTIMITWTEGAIDTHIVRRFCTALEAVIIHLARVGGFTNIERSILRDRTLLTLINQAHEKLK